MDSFADSLGRLKHLLRVSKDSEVALALGLSKTAFAERKRRGSFPEREVIALATSRPELGVDLGFVLTGTTAADAAQAMHDNFANRLRELRGSRSPPNFAKQLGVSVDELWRLETGGAKPTAAFFERLVALHPDEAAPWLAGGPVGSLGQELQSAEVNLVKNYRASSAPDQAALRHQAAFYANRPSHDSSDQVDLDLVRDYRPNRDRVATAVKKTKP